MAAKSLSAEHRKVLERDSSITPGIIEQRGYWTAKSVQELVNLGFFGVTKEQLPSLVIPILGVDGDVVYYQHRPDHPRSDKDGRPVKYESLPGQPPRIDVSPCIRHQIDDPGIPLWITEGVKKADSAAVRGLCCIALIGVWNWRGKGANGGSLELADWDRIAIKGRVIYIAFDSDVMVKPPVKRALQRLAKVLLRRGAKEIRPVVMPQQPTGKTGLDDWFAAGNTATDLTKHVDHDLLRHTGIVCNNRGLAEISTDALTALVESNFPPSVFVRAGELVRIKTDERSIAKIESVTPPMARGILARSTSWVVVRKDGVTEVSPPKEVVEDLLALPDWPEIPPIIAITMAPVLGPSRELSMSPGYDPSSGFFIASRETWPTWTGSTESALSFLFDDMLGDFPFSTAADRAHALALMLLPIVRPIIDGPTPLHLIDAPVQGSGKSLLGKLCLMPTVGDKISATTGTRDEEEWRKKIASSLLEGRAYIFLDNLSRKVDSDTLAGVLTSTEWNDRALSTMRNINVPVRCAWLATANNAELSRDIVRRTVWIRLDAGVEHPEDRTGFKHANIEQWVKDHRSKIVSALCHLITSWIAQGSPLLEGRLLGSFEEWSKTIGGIMLCAGVKDYLGNITELRASANSDDDAWAAFYRRWYNLHESRAVVAGNLIEVFQEDEALNFMLGDKGPASQRQRLGFLIKKRIGIVASGFRVMRDSEFRGSTMYRLLSCDAGSRAGNGPALDGVMRELGEETQTPSQLPHALLLGSSGSNELDFEGVEVVEGVKTTLRTCAPAHSVAHARESRLGKCPSSPSTPSFEPENREGVWKDVDTTPSNSLTREASDLPDGPEVTI